MKKALFGIVLSSFLVACGYSTDNVKVADIYAGQKIGLLDKMTKEERDLLQKYIARKSVLLKKYEGDKVVFDSRDLGHGDFVVSDENGVSIDLGKDSHFKYDKNFNNIDVKNSLVFLNDNEVSVIAFDISGNKFEAVIVRPEKEALKKLLGNVTVKDAIAEQIENDTRMKDFIEKRQAENKKNEEDVKKQKELSSKLRVLLVEKYKASDKDLEFRFAFTNAKKKAVVAFRGIIEFYDTDGNKFYQMLIQDETGIKPRDLMNYDGEFEVDVTIPGEKKLMEINEDDITLNFIVTDILYEDGEVFGDKDYQEKADVLKRAIEIRSDNLKEEIIE